MLFRLALFIFHFTAFPFSFVSMYLVSSLIRTVLDFSFPYLSLYFVCFLSYVPSPHFLLSFFYSLLSIFLLSPLSFSLDLLFFSLFLPFRLSTIFSFSLDLLSLSLFLLPLSLPPFFRFFISFSSFSFY